MIEIWNVSNVSSLLSSIFANVASTQFKKQKINRTLEALSLGLTKVKNQKGKDDVIFCPGERRKSIEERRKGEDRRKRGKERGAGWKKELGQRKPERKRHLPIYPESEMKVIQSCPTLCDPIDYTVHGILQARILEWVAVPFSRGSSQPRDWTQVSSIASRFLTSWATRKAAEPQGIHPEVLKNFISQGVEEDLHWLFPLLPKVLCRCSTRSVCGWRNTADPFRLALYPR